MVSRKVECKKYVYMTIKKLNSRQFLKIGHSAMALVVVFNVVVVRMVVDSGDGGSVDDIMMVVAFQSKNKVV